jgi:hypothetical protein
VQFRATAVEAWEDKELGVITIHFDSGADQYAQFQGASEGFEDDYYDLGLIYLEINSQLYSGYDCFSSVTVAKDRLSILGISDNRMLEIASEVVVFFDIEGNQLKDVVSLLHKVFRDCPDKLTIDTKQ